VPEADPRQSSSGEAPVETTPTCSLILPDSARCRARHRMT
jgi:hypothetical protein